MDIFHTSTPVIGMIHLLPLPGSPRFSSTEKICDQARKDYFMLKEGGVDGVLVENFWDIPYFKDTVPPETVSWMTTIILSLNIDIPFGVNVLRNDCRSALAIAHATGGTFIRCNVLSGVMVTDQGIIEGKAPQIVRYRNILETGPPPSIKILADIHVKYASPLVEKSIEYTARNTVFRGMADGLIVTGSETGDPPRISDLRAVKNAVPDRPLFAGSGVTAENVESVLEFADGCIVGTAFKKNSKMGNPIEKERIKSFMKKVEKLR